MLSDFNVYMEPTCSVFYVAKTEKNEEIGPAVVAALTLSSNSNNADAAAKIYITHLIRMLL